jgi:hypothetical protein
MGVFMQHVSVAALALVFATLVLACLGSMAAIARYAV